MVFSMVQDLTWQSHSNRYPKCKSDFAWRWFWKFGILGLDIFRHYNDFSWNAYRAPSIGPVIIFFFLSNYFFFDLGAIHKLCCLKSGDFWRPLPYQDDILYAWRPLIWLKITGKDSLTDKCFTYVTKTIANLTTHSKKPGNYNGTIIFEIDIMNN